MGLAPFLGSCIKETDRSLSNERSYGERRRNPQAYRVPHRGPAQQAGLSRHSSVEDYARCRTAEGWTVPALREPRRSDGRGVRIRRRENARSFAAGDSGRENRNREAALAGG